MLQSVQHTLFSYFSKSRIKVNRIRNSNYLDGQQRWQMISAILLPFFTMINSFWLMMADPFWRNEWIYLLCVEKKSIFMYRRDCEPIVQVILTTCVNIIATAWAYILSVTEVSLPECFSSILPSSSSLSFIHHYQQQQYAASHYCLQRTQCHFVW